MGRTLAVLLLSAFPLRFKQFVLPTESIETQRKGGAEEIQRRFTALTNDERLLWCAELLEHLRDCFDRIVDQRRKRAKRISDIQLRR